MDRDPTLPPLPGDANAAPEVETTSRRLERAALELFVARSYAEVTVTEIADAAGVSRRSFFRHFETKADVLWGDSDARQSAFLAQLFSQPRYLDVKSALLAAIDVSSKINDMDDLDLLRVRVVKANDSLADLLAAWDRGMRDSFATWLGHRTQRPDDSLEIVAVAAGLVAMRRVVMERWFDSGGTDDVVMLAREALAPTSFDF